MALSLSISVVFLLFSATDWVEHRLSRSHALTDLSSGDGMEENFDHGPNSSRHERHVDADESVYTLRIEIGVHVEALDIVEEGV